MISRKLAWGVLLGGTFLSSPVLAQSSLAPAPEHWAQDARRVDRVTGQISWLSTDLQIGPKGAGGLTLVSLHSPGVASGVAIGTNWQGLVLSSSGSQVTAGVGTTSVTFNNNNGTFTPVQQNGATLTGSGSNYTYTDASGTQILFNVAPNKSSYTNILARAGAVLYPTGEQATLTWKTVGYCNSGGTIQATQASPTTGSQTGSTGAQSQSTTPQSAATAQPAAGGCTTVTYTRLQAVTSSQGYQLHFNYQSDDMQGDGPSLWTVLAGVSSVNTSQNYCDPTAGSCSTVVATVSYGTSFSSDRSTTYQFITDPIGRQTVFGSSNSQFTVQTPIASSPDIVYAVDSNKQVTNVTWRGLGYQYQQMVSGNQRTINSYSPTGDKEVTVADTSVARILSYTNGAGNTYSYSYTNGDLTSLQTPKNTKVVYTRDGNGNVTQTSYYATGASSESYHTSASYPGCASGVTCNLPTSTTDGNGNVTSYSYDQSNGNLLTVTGPSVSGGQAQTRYTYTSMQAQVRNSSGSLVGSGVSISKLTAMSSCRSSTNSCGGSSDETRTSLSYDNNLLPITQTVAAGDGSVTATTTTSYNAAGDTVSVQGPLGGSYITAFRYDAAHQLVGVVGPDPDGSGGKWAPAIRYSYNGDGNPTQVEQGTAPDQTDSGWSNFSSHRQVITGYDGNGRQVSQAVQAGGTTYAYSQFSYDSDGRLDCSVVRMNPNSFTGTGNACSLGSPGAYGNDRITRRYYDAANRVTGVYTGYGLNNAPMSSYSYNLNSDLQSVTDQNGNKMTYVYDGLLRLYQIQYPSATVGAGSSNTADYEQFAHDNNGNLTARKIRGSSSAPIISYGYDAMNRMTSKTLPSGTYNPSTSYSYDLAGNLLGATNSYPGNHSATTSFTYDALGRELSESSGFDGNSQTRSMQYDAAGRRTRLTWSGGPYVTYGYDFDSQLTSIQENGGSTIASFSYDDDGRRTGRTYWNGTSTSYGYDAVSRLTSLQLNGTQSTSVTLGSYNPAGQIGSRANSNDAYAWTAGANVNRSYTVNGLNQYSAIAGTNQTYDAKGNMTSGGSTTLTFSAENKLATGGNGSFYYDGLGRLAYNSVSGTRYDYDGNVLVSESNYNGGVLRRYVAGPSTDETVLWYEGSDTNSKRFLDQDERGSVTRITDLNANLVGVNTYDEHGIPGPNNQGRFGFTGQAWLPEVGLYNYKARMYSPQLGRFLQLDPARDINGNNWYNYAGSDAVNNTDPSGLELVDQDSGGGGGGGGGQMLSPDSISPGTLRGTYTPDPTPSVTYPPVPTSQWPTGAQFVFPNIGPANPTTFAPKKVVLDNTCAGVAAAKNPDVQSKALGILDQSLNAQTQNPDGPSTREFGFSGRPYFFQRFFGPGFVTSETVPGSYSAVEIPHGWFDTFDVHTHAGINQDPRPSDLDIRETPNKTTSLIIDRHGVIRCFRKGS